MPHIHRSESFFLCLPACGNVAAGKWDSGCQHKAFAIHSLSSVRSEFMNLENRNVATKTIGSRVFEIIIHQVTAINSLINSITNARNHLFASKEWIKMKKHFTWLLILMCGAAAHVRYWHMSTGVSFFVRMDVALWTPSVGNTGVYPTVMTLLPISMEVLFKPIAVTFVVVIRYRVALRVWPIECVEN